MPVGTCAAILLHGRNQKGENAIISMGNPWPVEDGRLDKSSTVSSPGELLWLILYTTVSRRIKVHLPSNHPSHNRSLVYLSLPYCTLPRPSFLFLRMTAPKLLSPCHRLFFFWEETQVKTTKHVLEKLVKEAQLSWKLSTNSQILLRNICLWGKYLLNSGVGDLGSLERSPEGQLHFLWRKH